MPVIALQQSIERSMLVVLSHQEHASTPQKVIGQDAWSELTEDRIDSAAFVGVMRRV
jgi:hypothetical protein